MQLSYDKYGNLKEIRTDKYKYEKDLIFSIFFAIIVVCLFFFLDGEFLIIPSILVVLFLLLIIIMSLNNYVRLVFDKEKIILYRRFKKISINYSELNIVAHIPKITAGNIQMYYHGDMSTICFSKSKEVNLKKFSIKIRAKVLSISGGYVGKDIIFICLSDRKSPRSKQIYFLIKEKINEMCPDNTIDFREEDPNKTKYW